MDVSYATWDVHARPPSNKPRPHPGRVYPEGKEGDSYCSSRHFVPVCDELSHALANQTTSSSVRGEGEKQGVRVKNEGSE